MSVTIRCAYTAEPNFPATDNHPDAVRYQVAGYWVDAIGGQPSEADVLALFVAPPPEIVSDRQLAQQLALVGLITQAEAIAWVSTGTLPAAIASFIVALPAEVQFDAQMKLKGATEFHRSSPLVAAFAQMQGLTPTQADDLWRAAAVL